jgi:hypothetical protein
MPAAEGKVDVGLPLRGFCSTDTTMVRITYTYGRVCEELIVASAYLP